VEAKEAETLKPEQRREVTCRNVQNGTGCECKGCKRTKRMEEPQQEEQKKKWQRGCNLDQLPQSTDQRAQELAAMEQIKVQCEGMKGSWNWAVGTGSRIRGLGNRGTRNW
jgi:hypothetical protein